MAQVNEKACQECPPELREACIGRAILSPGAKRVLRDAFADGSVTEAMMRQLQENCLQELESSSERPRRGLLSRRKHADSDGPVPISSAEDDLPPEFPVVEAETPSKAAPLLVADAPFEDLGLLSPTGRGAALTEDPTLVIDAHAMKAFLEHAAEGNSAGELLAETIVRDEKPTAGISRMLMVQETGHRIALPYDGRITLGSLDPFGRIFPDVDLTFDDQFARSLATVHAGIAGQNGEHFIEDYGSLTGSWINGKRLTSRMPYRLNLSDELLLGRCALHYQEVPRSWTAAGAACFLFSTATGHTFPLAAQEEIIIGRADPRLEFKPDVDLSGEGDTALLVSRRHAALRYRGGFIEVADLGSTNKTRVDGVAVPPGVWVPLRPGQHLWLGGFGLSLDTYD